MQHGYGPAACTCSMDIQHARAAWTFTRDMKQGNSQEAYSTDMQQEQAAWKRFRNMQQAQAASKFSRYLQQGQTARHSAGTCSRARDMHTPYSRPLIFPLPSRFGLRNRVSSVLRQIEGKPRIRAFFFRARRFRYFRAGFSLRSRAFLVCTR